MKKLLVLLMASVISVSLIACGSSGDMSAIEGQSTNMEEESFSTESEISESESEDVSEVMVEEGPKVLVKVSHCDSYETPRQTTEYEYDEVGNCIKAVTDYGCEEFTYDSSGKEISHTLYSNSGEKNQWDESTYDEDGRLIEKLYYSASTISLGYYYDKYTYDEIGNVIRIDTLIVEEGVESPGEYYIYEYDENGKIIKESLYGKYYAYNTIDQCIEYEYDESGNQIKKLVYNNVYYANEMALESTYEYKYDESGKLIEEKGSEFASDDYYVVYEYDEDGDLVKEIFYLDEEHTSFGGCIKYEYDNLIIEK